MKGTESSFLSAAFTDLMVSLAVIFIMLTVVFIREASSRSQKGKEMVRSSLSEILKKNQLPLKQDPNDPLVMSVSVRENDLKFQVNSANLSPEGAQFVESFMPGLTQQLCSEPMRSSVDAVIIEGHTDRSGENGEEGMRRNIKLSQNRSFAVLERALLSVKADPKLTECLLSLTSATGRGSRVPVEVKGIYSADLSRRVEIKIRVKSREQEMQSAPLLQLPNELHP